MKLVAVAQQVCDAAQTASLETLDQPLELLNHTLRQDLAQDDLHRAQNLLEDARTALYVRRAHIIRALQQNRSNGLYDDPRSALNSWEFSG